MNIFKINANNFLYSAKVCCPLCIKEGRDLTKLNKTPDFINECEKIHKGKYDLSKVEYKGWVQPIEVVCKEHGIWFPSAGNFQRGSGCPFCMKTENRYTNNPTKLYYIKYKGVYKLGITTRDIYLRYKSKDIPVRPVHGSSWQNHPDTKFHSVWVPTTRHKHGYGHGVPDYVYHYIHDAQILVPHSRTAIPVY